MVADRWAAILVEIDKRVGGDLGLATREFERLADLC
jgi:hypothetical protein